LFSQSTETLYSRDFIKHTELVKVYTQCLSHNWTSSIVTLAKVQGGLLAKEHWDIFNFFFPTIFSVEQGS